MKDIIEKEKWYPMLHATSFEMQCAYCLNAFLDTLKGCNDDELPTMLNVFKHSIENISKHLK